MAQGAQFENLFVSEGISKPPPRRNREDAAASKEVASNVLSSVDETTRGMKVNLHARQNINFKVMLWKKQVGAAWDWDMESWARSAGAGGTACFDATLQER